MAGFTPALIKPLDIWKKALSFIVTFPTIVTSAQTNEPELPIVNGHEIRLLLIVVDPERVDVAEPAPAKLDSKTKVAPVVLLIMEFVVDPNSKESFNNIRPVQEGKLKVYPFVTVIMHSITKIVVLPAAALFKISVAEVKVRFWRDMVPELGGVWTPVIMDILLIYLLGRA